MNASEKNMNIKMLQMMELTAKINLDLKNGIMQKETTFIKMIQIWESHFLNQARNR